MKKLLFTLLLAVMAYGTSFAKKEYAEVMPEESKYSITQVGTNKYQYLLITEKYLKKTPLSYGDLAGNSCTECCIAWGGGKPFGFNADKTKTMTSSYQTIELRSLDPADNSTQEVEVGIGSDLGYVSSPFCASKSRIYFGTKQGMYYTTLSNPEVVHKVHDRNYGTFIGEYNGELYMADMKTLWRCNPSTYKIQSVMKDYYAYSMHYPYVYCSKGCREGRGEITRYNLKTKKFDKILSNPKQGYYGPEVSPNGRWLLLTANSLSPVSKKQNVDIYLYDLQSGKLHQLTTHPGHDWFPQWSRDGKMVYFLSSRYVGNSKDYRKSVLYRMDVSSIVGK